MKKFLLGVLFVIAGITLLSGKIHWENRVYSIQAKGGSEPESRVEVIINDHIGKAKAETIKTVDLSEIKGNAMEKKLETVKLLPLELQSVFEKAIYENEKVHMMIIGSTSTSQKEGAWPDLLKNRLVKVYGDSVIDVTTREIKEKTSNDILSEKILNGVAEGKIDILLFEPFLLSDNGKVEMPERLKNLTAFIHLFKEQNPHITILIQPPNPVYGAYYYPKEEYDLERFAKNNHLTYLDHWEAWPDYNTEGILRYLDNGVTPNEKGNELWANYLAEYFIQNGIQLSM